MIIDIAKSQIYISAGALSGLFFVWTQALATPAVDMWQHASGARVALVAAPAIPMLDVRLEFDGGTRRDPAEKAGLASATALMSGRGVA
ncbi:MAG: insulinase family protein, partial [Bacteroidota bacterium]